MAAAADPLARGVLERSGGLYDGPLERRRRPRRGCSEHEFEDWLALASARADPFMAWLGVVFALAVGYDLAVDLSPASELALEITGWVIWAIFLADFAVKLWIAPSKRTFIRRNWLSALMLAVPVLRLVRFASLLRLRRALPAARVVTSSYRVRGTARHLLRSRLWYLAALVSIAGAASAELVFVFERGHRGFGDFGDALTWGSSAVIGMQADPVPETAGGRMVMLASFGFGVVVVAGFAAMLGAFLIQDRDERVASAEEQPAAGR